MKLRPFGKTGLQVSEVAFGGGRSGGILINASEEKRREAVMRALDLGVNWFDTARTIEKIISLLLSLMFPCPVR